MSSETLRELGHQLAGKIKGHVAKQLAAIIDGLGAIERRLAELEKRKEDQDESIIIMCETTSGETLEISLSEGNTVRLSLHDVA